ncbi:hypothetical protein L0156_19800 [bacterium]|nr:hypothetical protein [bacterium]
MMTRNDSRALLIVLLLLTGAFSCKDHKGQEPSQKEGPGSDLAWTKADDERPPKEVKEVQLPESLPVDALAQDLQQKYGCVQALPFQTESEHFWILVCREAESDYLVGCFRKQAIEYVHIGVDVHLFGFTKAVVSSASNSRNVLSTTHIETKEGYHLKIDSSECAIEPDEGEWVELPRN